MVHPERGDLEGTDGVLGPRLDLVEGGRPQELVLLELAGDQTDGQLRGVDRGALDPGQDVGQAAGVVLVSVGQQDGLDRLGVLRQVRGVGHDEVDAEHLRLGEREAAVHDEDLAVGLDGGDVLANLTYTTERNDSKGPWHCVL